MSLKGHTCIFLKTEPLLCATRVGQPPPPRYSGVLLHLSEVDVLRRRQVESLLVDLVLQQALREPVGHLHVAAVEALRVHSGVGQHGGGLLNASGVQERRVPVELFRLEEKNAAEDQQLTFTLTQQFICMS